MTPPAARALQPWRILVVDDSEDDRADIRRLLLRGSDRVYLFHETHGVAATIRAVLDAPDALPDCIVLDYHLSDGTALDVLEGLRLPEGGCICPVVVLTGEGGRAVANAVLQAGAQDFVGKTWSTEESLTRAVENAVERWKLAGEVKAGEARFRHMAAAIPEAIWMTDAQGRRVYFNDRWRLAFGVARGEPLFMDFLRSTLHPDDREPAVAYIAQQQALGAPFEVDVRLRCVDGKYRWYQKRGTPVRDARGRISHWYGVTMDIHERKEMALRLALALEASKTGIWNWDPLTDAVTWTPEAYVIHGMRQGEFRETGAAFFELVHPDDRKSVERAVRAAIRNRTLYKSEFRVVRPSGEVVWVRNLGRAVDDDSGRVRVLGTIIDITEQKRAEAALRAKERELQSLADTSPVVIARFDRELRHRFISAAIEKLTRRSAGDFIGKTNRELGMPEDLCNVWDAALASVFDGGGPTSLDFEFRSSEGTRYLESRLVPELDVDGTIAFVVCVTLDVTDQRAAQEAVRVSEERLARAQQAARVGTWDWNVLTGEAVWTDEAWRLFAGARTEKPVTFETWLAAIHPEDRDSAAARALAALETGKYRDEFRVAHPDGTELILEAAGEAFFGADGAPARLVGTVRDVTESRAASQAVIDALERANLAVTARDRLMSLLSHDLRTPLGAILMAASVLEQLGAGGQRQVQMIKRQSTRMGKMVDELLDASQLRAGKGLELAIEDVDLIALAREAVEEFRASAPKHDIQLEGNATDVVGHWDRMRLERVVRNLLSNAIKYSPSGGHIRIFVEPTSLAGTAWVELSVEDEGIGIGPADRERIFEWFSRAGNTHGIEGIGIGLAGVRHIVEQHGGTISVDGHLGKGSKFTVRLPRHGVLAQPRQASLQPRG